MSAVVVARNLGKSYRTYAHEVRRVWGWITGRPSGFMDNWVLREVSFTLGRGESIGILGRNGAGKSTLLKLLAGTVSATEGSIGVNGTVSAILELGVGFNAEFTGRENAMHSLILFGLSATEAEAIVPEIEAFADIGEYFDRPLRTYSSGMSVRVAFAAATAVRPDLLIVDEALAVGDAYFQAKCHERIQMFRENGTAFIYVSHSAGDVAQRCERAIFLKRGRMEASGTAREVSNIYLDDIFGKGRPGRPEAAEPHSAAAEKEPEFSADAADVYATRMHYRKDEYRWGDGGASIRDYALLADGDLYPSTLRTRQKVRVAFKVLFERPVERPVYGLLVKTLDGMFVYGTNSTLVREGASMSPAAAGDVRLAAFDLPMLLNTGSYLLSVGVSEQDGGGELVPLDRRYDSILVPVENETPLPGHIDLGAAFSLTALAGSAIGSGSQA
jgi:lipopolysaccharide transport system ATP-binding protein